MKKIYLIRHGESEANAGNAWQGSQSMLTDKGRAQAASVGQRLKAVSLDALVSSTLPRAKESAEIISEAMGKGLEYSELFVERRRPSVQAGKVRNDPESLEIDAQIIAHFGEPDWHHSDEENYHDLTARGRVALKYLIEHPKDEIVVLTHGYFMRVMLACALAGESLTPELCDHFLSSFRTANASISRLRYDPAAPRPWWLWTWNDHAHLE